jgi:hypothetical protein
MLDARIGQLVARSGRVSEISASQYQAFDTVVIINETAQRIEQPYVVVRKGSDLVLIYADGTEVVLENYFDGETVLVLDGAGAGITLPPSAAPIGAIGDTALYAFAGSKDAASAILLNSSQFSPLQTFLADDASGGFAGFSLGAIAGLGGLAALAGKSAPSAEAAPATMIGGSFVAGPVLQGHSLTVDIYSSTGTLLQRDVPLDDTGRFSVTLEGTHSHVIAILRNPDAENDYRDETTGLPTNINATLMGIGAGVTEGMTTTVSLNINPLTTIAARLAGIGPEGTIPAEGIAPGVIEQTTAQVAELFGLADINTVPPLTIFDEGFDDTDGDITEAEKYGQVLAMLSGLDFNNEGNTDATIRNLAEVIQQGGEAAPQAVRDQLMQGAVAFEFNNPGETQDRADLLNAPALNVENAPTVGTGGTPVPESIAQANLLAEVLKEGAAPSTTAALQNLIDTVNAIQAIAAQEEGADLPQAAQTQLTEANLTALGLRGLAAPSPYLDAFLAVIAARANDGSETDSVAELQALLDVVIAEILTPSVAAGYGEVLVTLRDAANSAVLTYTDPNDNLRTLAVERNQNGDWVGAGGSGLPAGFAFDGNILRIANAELKHEGSVTVAVGDVAGNAAGVTSGEFDTLALAPVVNQAITDQANTVSGTGEVGATVTVTTEANGGGSVIGTAVVWADGSWSVVAQSPIADGATLYATQRDLAGNQSTEAAQATFTDTDGDGTRNSTDTDADGDGIEDVPELAFESTVITSAGTVAATSTVTSPTTGYTETSRIVDGGMITIVAQAPGESGANTNAPGQNLGTQSSFTIRVEPVETETFENATISIAIDRFDDGLFVQINDAVIVDFNAGDWFFTPNGSLRFGGIVNDKYDTVGNNGLWEPWFGEGNPTLEINTETGTVRLLVDVRDGGRADVLADLALENGTMNAPDGTRNPRPDPLPALDFEAGVTITTAYNNRDGSAQIGVQTITVAAEFSGVDDIDGDGIRNHLDIDTDGDRIWDRYEGTTDADNDRIAAYRDTHSTGSDTSDTIAASLTQGDIAALAGGTSSDRVEGGSYTNGSFSNQFILLTDAVNLDFSAIADTAFADIEYIDMQDGTNAQTITIDEASLIAMTDADNELVIVGDSHDTVIATGAVRTTLQVSIQNQTHTIWELGAGRLIIDDEISVLST